MWVQWRQMLEWVPSTYKGFSSPFLEVPTHSCCLT